EDIGNAHIPNVNLKQDWWKPLSEEDRLVTPEPSWSIPSSDLPQGITELIQKDLEGPAFEIVKVFHPNVLHLQYQMEECHKVLTDQVDDAIIRHNVSKPLPLGGQPGQITIQADFFFNKDLEYLRYGSKGGRHALSILKMKAAYYPDVGLEQMVLDQMCIEEECKYDIAAIAVRTHMRILSVVGIEVFSLYRYHYMKTNVLCRADLNEYITAERDFKYLYPSHFEDLYLLNLQGHLNHLPPQDKKILSTAVNLWTKNLVIRQRVEDFQLGFESYQTQLNLNKPRWDATGFEFKHDFTIIDSPRAVTFRNKYRVQMIMRFNEIHKFSDGTLQQIDEALDYLVKEFKWVSNSLVHSLRAWSTLRRSGLRTASTTAKPCQVDSSEFYLITGILTGDLKIMMESSTEENDQSDFWSNQQDWKIITWRLYEACGVCILELEDGIVIHMLVERRYPFSKELLQRMLDLGLEVERESSVALDLIRFTKQQIDEE
ncbi:hypothetical protein Tco_0233291, partial [Tanacetum coccineum]